MTNSPVFLMVSLIICAATACAPIGRGIQQVGTQLHEETIAMDHRVRDWFDSENQTAREHDLPAPTTAYCYKTLSDISCYAHPIAGQEERLIGKQEPKPIFAGTPPIPEIKPEAPVIIAEKVESDAITATAPMPIPVEVSNLPEDEIVPQIQTKKPSINRQPRPLIPVFDNSNN